MKAGPVVLTMGERVGVRGRARGAGCGLWMVLLMCVKLDGVRWAGSSECMACSTRFGKVFRVCVDITQPPHSGRCVMSTTSIVHTSDCLYIDILYMQERTKRIKYT